MSVFLYTGNSTRAGIMCLWFTIFSLAPGTMNYYLTICPNIHTKVRKQVQKPLSLKTFYLHMPHSFNNWISLESQWDGRGSIGNRRGERQSPLLKGTKYQLWLRPDLQGQEYQLPSACNFFLIFHFILSTNCMGEDMFPIF